MSSASGALQLAGGGMMATGLGAPIGAVLYGIGQAGSMISGAGLMLESFFDKESGTEDSQFDEKEYLKRTAGQTIRDISRRRWSS